MNDTSPDGLSFNRLRIANQKRANLWNRGVPTSPMFCMIELAGEVGEACNAMKKMERQSLEMVGGANDNGNLADELADVVICADLAAMAMGVDLGEAVARKFNKTSRKHGFDVLLPQQDEQHPRPGTIDGGDRCSS